MTFLSIGLNIFVFRWWHISICPMNAQPGTRKDVGFYASSHGKNSDTHPPKSGWFCMPLGEGIWPPPTLKIMFADEDEDIAHKEMNG